MFFLYFSIEAYLPVFFTKGQ